MSKLTDALRGTTSRAEAHQVIADANPSAAELKQAATDLNIPANGRKADVAERLANGTGGAHVKFAALREHFGK